MIGYSNNGQHGFANLLEKAGLSNELISSLLTTGKGPEYKFSQHLRELKTSRNLKKFILDISSDVRSEFAGELDSCMKEMKDIVKNYSALCKGKAGYEKKDQALLESFTGKLNENRKLISEVERELSEMGLTPIY